MTDKAKIRLIKRGLDEGGGILRLAPTWVPRTFIMPGRRLKLDSRDLYALGANRGGICERWLASTVRADNGPGTPEDEGLSYIVLEEGFEIRKVLLTEAIELEGKTLLGDAVVQKYGSWLALAKILDYLGSCPFHLHQRDEDVVNLGLMGKPEAYYFPPELNTTESHFPYSFFGLEPGTTKEDIRRCLQRWNEGENGILNYSKAYKINPGSGWDTPAGILHAPGSLVTYEVQRASDVLAIFQSMVEGRPYPWDLLVKDVPEEFKQDLDYIVDLIDWEANIEPEYMKKRLHSPIPCDQSEVMEEAGYSEKWIIYGSPYFSAKELTVFPGRSVTTHEEVVYGLVVVQGWGKIGTMEVETPTLIRYGQLTSDELFMSAPAAPAVKITNSSRYENLVCLKYFGPENPNVPKISPSRPKRVG